MRSAPLDIINSIHVAEGDVSEPFFLLSVEVDRQMDVSNLAILTEVIPQLGLLYVIAEAAH